MKDKHEPAKIVKGGFRATLALILAIIALIFSIISFNRTTGQTEYQVEIKELKEKLEKMKKETAERVGIIRQETASALKKMGIEIKKQEKKTETPQNQ